MDEQRFFFAEFQSPGSHMSHDQSQAAVSNEVVRLAKKYPARWLAPAILTTIAAVAYVMLRPAVWEASQALTVRDETSTTASEHLGKFHLVEDMKSVQETLLELTKSRAVLRAALEDVGPPSERTVNAAWPTDDEVNALQGAVKLSPPKGAEFGKTEVFYLQVQSTDRRRAIRLASAVSDQLKKRFDELRNARAQSLINELSKTVTLAQADLKVAADQLMKIDAEAGPDLGELRTLADALAGDSPLRRSVSEMETELRGARATEQLNVELLRLLENSQGDPAFLMSAPGKLLDTQPVLKKLKEALTDAQLSTAKLLGSLDPSHPSVQAAKAAEQEITHHVNDEVTAAVRGLKIDLRLAGDRCNILEKQIDNVKTRLNRLASMRTDYASDAAQVHRRTDTLKSAENQLAEAREPGRRSYHQLDQPDRQPRNGRNADRRGPHRDRASRHVRGTAAGVRTAGAHRSGIAFARGGRYESNRATANEAVHAASRRTDRTGLQGGYASYRHSRRIAERRCSRLRRGRPNGHWRAGAANSSAFPLGKMTLKQALRKVEAVVS